MPVGEQAVPEGRLELFFSIQFDSAARFSGAGGLAALRLIPALFPPRKPRLAFPEARKIAPAALAAVRRRSHPDQKSYPHRGVVIMFRPGVQFVTQALRTPCVSPAPQIPDLRAESRVALPAPKRHDAGGRLQPLAEAAQLRCPQASRAALRTGCKRYGQLVTQCSPNRQSWRALQHPRDP